MDRGVNTNLHPLFVSTESRWKKHRNLIGSVHRAARISYSPVRPHYRLTRLSVVSTETLFFPFSLFSDFMSTPCFSEWEMGYVRRKIDKNMAGTDGNSGFCDYICRTPPHAIEIYLQDDFLVFADCLRTLSFITCSIPLCY